MAIFSLTLSQERTTLLFDLAEYVVADYKTVATVYFINKQIKLNFDSMSQQDIHQ